MALQGQEENIIEKGLESILRENALDYYEEIICHRAIPDGRDGLTEVQRRILYDCYLNKWDSSKPHIKSARVIGDTIGRFHPHGSSSCYITSANMAQDWKNQITLIDFHGNLGSISGSMPGAERYTEQRLSKSSSAFILDEFKYDCVDMIMNYSQDEYEPLTLPTKLPFYIINGSFGIASGYAVGVPTHNPREVLQELIKRIKDDTYEIRLLPDFPTGATICNTSDIEIAYKDMPKAIEKKNSKAVIRSTMELDEKHNKIYITEIPYMLTAESIILSIKDAIKPPKKDGAKAIGGKDVPRITDISNVKNLTGKNKLRIEITCKRGADLETVKQQLYRYTRCQNTLPISYIYCIGDTFHICKSVTNYFDLFIDYRKNTIKRIKNGIIRQKKARVHIINGLLLILKGNNIDDVIQKIKKCKSNKEIIDMLMNDYDLDSVQAERIADYKLRQLSGFAIDDLKSERDKLNSEIEEELEYFRNPDKIIELMVNEYETILDKYFTEKKYPRRTRLENINTKSDEVMLESIPDENYIMVFTKKGYIKKLEMLKSQKRNTKGVSVGKLKDEDYVIGVTVLNSRDSVFIFTENGKVYKYNVYEIPLTTTSKLGHFISKDISGETIVNIIPVKKDELENSESNNIGILSVSKLNKVKITNLSEYTNVRKDGIISMKVRKYDSVVSVERVDYEKDDSIIALNSAGNAIRVGLDKIPNCKRPTEGSNLFASLIISKGITIKSVAVVNEDSEYYVYISSNGYGKLMETSEFEPQYRGTKGKLAAKVRENDSAEKLIPIHENDNLIIVSNKNLVTINSSELTLLKRPTYGNKVKKCTNGEFVIDIAVDKTEITV